MSESVSPAILAPMTKADEYDDPPRDALRAVLQEEVSSLGELLSDGHRRSVAILAVVLTGDGKPRVASLLSDMDEGDRAVIASELIRCLELEFGTNG